jgi:hypothetical protein
MTSKATRRFWKLYQELPEVVQRLAVENYRLWRGDPAIRRWISRN